MCRPVHNMLHVTTYFVSTSKSIKAYSRPQRRLVYSRQAGPHAGTHSRTYYYMLLRYVMLHIENYCIYYLVFCSAPSYCSILRCTNIMLWYWSRITRYCTILYYDTMLTAYIEVHMLQDKVFRYTPDRSCQWPGVLAPTVQQP